MSEETNLHGNVTVTREAPQTHALFEATGIGQVVLDGIDHLGDIMKEAANWTCSKGPGAVLGLLGFGASTDSQEADPEPRVATAQIIERSVIPYEADIVTLGNLTAPALPTQMQSRESSMMMAC